MLPVQRQLFGEGLGVDRRALGQSVDVGRDAPLPHRQVREILLLVRLLSRDAALAATGTGHRMRREQQGSPPNGPLCLPMRQALAGAMGGARSGYSLAATY